MIFSDRTKPLGPESRPFNWRWPNLTLSDYNALLASQGGGCAINGCTRRPKTRRFSVDHDHASGRVRGILCHVHNRRLWAGATAADLRAMADYLERTL